MSETKLTKKLSPVARLLGYGGVIPFAALAAAIILKLDVTNLGVADPARALLAYGAVIISFIGAVHWGIALRLPVQEQGRLLVYSVMPALAAWVWLLLPVRMGLWGMAFTVLVMFFIDRTMLGKLVPEAYLDMRLHLSIVVTLSLVVGAFGVAS